MVSIASYSGAYPLAVSGFRIRSNVYFTSAEVNFSPLWKVALSTRSNVHVVGSFCVHLVARTPTSLPFSSKSISLLKMLS
jgi:hypothetical protein